MNLRKKVDALRMPKLDTLLNQQHEQILRLRTLLDKIDSQQED
jgi:hypothetical protein